MRFLPLCCSRKEDLTMYPHSAEGIMYRAEFLSEQNRPMEAIECYQQGLAIIEAGLQGSTDSRKEYLLSEKKKYSEIAEKLQKKVMQTKKSTIFHELITIDENSTGHSYEALFGRFLDKEVTFVIIEDAYVRKFHQCQNFHRFCEVLVKSCGNLKIIKLLTSRDDGPDAAAINQNQSQMFDALRDALSNYKITLKIEFLLSLHDRQIILSNGYIIKIGRGLNIYKAPGKENQFYMGKYDMNLRQCLSTNIDIYFRKDITSAIKL